ncbi:MAG: hypothetical protein AAFQ33_16160, partial [Pseudomonadota bacterium]
PPTLDAPLARPSAGVEVRFPEGLYRQTRRAAGHAPGAVVTLDRWLALSPPPLEGTLIYVGGALRTFTAAPGAEPGDQVNLCCDRQGRAEQGE